MQPARPPSPLEAGEDGTPSTAPTRFTVLKHSWRGTYTRQVEISPFELCTLDTEGWVTNRWVQEDVVGAVALDNAMGFIMHVHGGLCGLCVQSIRFTSQPNDRDQIVSLINRASISNFTKEVVRELAADSLEVSFPANGQPMVVIAPSASLDDAFHLLLERQIHSAPVLSTGLRNSSSVSPHKSGPKYIGYLDQRDMLSYAVLGYKQRQRPPENSRYAEARLQGHGVGASISDALVGQTPAYLARRNPITMLHPTASWYDACALLSSGRMRRVALQGADGEIRAIISQSRAAAHLLTILAADAQLHATALATPIFALGARLRKVYSCISTQPAIEGFELMEKQRVSGIAVIDASGTLLGGLSAKDLQKVIRRRDGNVMVQPIHEYLGPKRVCVEAGKKLSVQIWCSAYELFQKFATIQSHRLFIVDERGMLRGLVSLVDALSMVLGKQRETAQGGSPVRSPARSPLRKGLRLT